jgi:hypothetical protein
MISFTLKINYSHVSLCTTLIFDPFDRELAIKLKNILKNQEPLEFKVEFENTNSSSLDYLINIKLSGI